MNAYELADKLEDKDRLWNVDEMLMIKTCNMLRQQADRIEKLEELLREYTAIKMQQQNRIAELEKLVSEMKYEKSSGVYEKQTPLTEEQIHNIYLFIEGKVAGLHEHQIKADFPVMLIRAVEEMHGIK